MKTKLIIAAALISGVAYGQQYGYSPEVQAYGDRMRGDFRSTAILERLEEIHATQRRQRADIEEIEELQWEPRPIFIQPQPLPLWCEDLE